MSLTCTWYGYRNQQSNKKGKEREGRTGEKTLLAMEKMVFLEKRPLRQIRVFVTYSYVLL